jgi:ABC-type glycerol-3-phosphate transport system substrate-binding protein
MKVKSGIAVCTLAVVCSLAASTDAPGVEKSVVRWTRGGSINEYLKKYAGAARPRSLVEIPAVEYSASKGAELKVLSEYEGERNVLSWTGESGWVEWNFTVPESGLYSANLRYFPLGVKGMNVEFAVYIDGALPYDDFASVRFERVWKDETEIRKDYYGNDLRPNQIEAPCWSSRDFLDTQGFYNKSLPVYLAAGGHTIRLELRREAVVLKGIRFYNPERPRSYAEIEARYKAEGRSDAKDVFVKVQAEAAHRKSDSTLAPTYDRSNAATEPAHPAKIRLNTLGGNWTWKLPGQWVEWKIEVPEDGLYKFFVKARQNYQRGMAAVRRIYVDGSVPFAEFDDVEFPYSLAWALVSPGAGGKPCLVYLSKGEHTIRMESTLGRLTPILTAVDDLTYEVNALRRRFIMIMGSEPDLYRDYQLEKEIPGLTESLLNLADRFTEQADEFERITGQKGTEAATLRRMADQLLDFAERPQYIPHHQTNFRDNIASLATWLLYRKEIPLEVDYLGFASPEKKLPAAEAGFFRQVWMSILSFFASFTEDYNSIGRQEKGDVVSVWIQSGRDQAQILRDLITNDFTAKTGIKVNLSLAQGGLIEATLAGRGPEIALFTSRGQPVNLAARNALYDLSKFSDCESIAAERFMPGALDPYRYRGGVYALPITQDFHMMFYRSDIFEELGLKPPETWEELNAIIPVLQRNNMMISLPYQQQDALELIDAGMGARNLFPTLLAQHGGSFYIDDGRKSGLTRPEAYAAFKQWTDFYASYGFIVKYDFYTRFRAGEMPLGIESYQLYNKLVAAAPEIRNQWAMLPIPGTRRPDGTIDRTEAASGSACVMFSKIKNPQAGWEFLKWWTSGEVQLAFIRQLETLLGPAARVPTANVWTFERMAWSKSEADALRYQWKYVKDIPEVPGGYYSIRMIDTAFSRVFYNFENPRAVLYKYTLMIDEEIARKRKELGLE